MKKHSVILVVVLLLTLLVAASPVLADERPVRVAGEITAIDATVGQLTVLPRYRDPITVQTMEDTRFFRKVNHGGLEEISFESLVVGDRVQVVGTWDGDLLQAGKVIVVPPPPPPLVEIHGAISALDSENDTLIVKLEGGTEVTVQTSEETEFYRVAQHGRLEPIAFEDLAVEDWVRVHGLREEEVFLAKRVTVMPVAPPPPLRLAFGRIVRLDPEGTFSLKPRRGNEIPVGTGDETKFYRKLRWGRLEPISYSDLAVGDWVSVLGRWDGAALNARAVIIMRGHADDLEGVVEVEELLGAEELAEDSILQVEP
jgi:hypothetical protein